MSLKLEHVEISVASTLECFFEDILVQPLFGLTKGPLCGLLWTVVKDLGLDLCVAAVGPLWCSLTGGGGRPQRPNH